MRLPPRLASWPARALLVTAIVALAGGAVAGYGIWTGSAAAGHDHGAMGHESHHGPAPWLALVEYERRNSEAGGHGHGHGGHGEHGASGTYRPRASVVGLFAYDGPPDAQGFLDRCGTDANCLLPLLDRLLLARGSEAAFSMLDELAKLHPEVKRQDHLMAHELGRKALEAYGTIEETLATCSYKVFQGCLHGSLQAYFESAGVDFAKLPGLCPTDNAFRAYACWHGVGHGLMLAYDFDLEASLRACDALPRDVDRSNCHGGAFMENVVSYFHSLGPNANDHGHDLANVSFYVDRDRPHYPCDVSPRKSQPACWRLQTSLILYHNGYDYEDAANQCGLAPKEHVATCFNSLGRDTAARMPNDIPRASSICALAPTEDARAMCVSGFIATIILDHADPNAALPRCAQFEGDDQRACYERMGELGANMICLLYTSPSPRDRG